MNIIILGANGAIGKLTTERALARGWRVKAYIRRAHALDINHPNLQIVIGNLDDTEKIKQLIRGADVVVSALGPVLAKSRKVTNLPIADAHELIIKLMTELKVKRFITLGTPTIKAKEDRKQLITWLPGSMAKLIFPTGYQEMKRIEKLVKNSSLDWTVVRIINPNVKYAGQGYAITFGDDKGSMGVSKENVANCLVDSVVNQAYIGKMPIVFNTKGGL